MKILIDARLYGPENAGNGRYTMNLVESLASIDKENDYIILLRKERFNSLVLPKNWRKVLADFKHYSFTEQFELPVIIATYNPDIVHFPHFNVPLLYFGKFITTIHDMIMHESKGGDATSRKFPIYQIWRLGYHLSFAKAVFGSSKIITPSNFVKEEITKYYKISDKKVDVIYEGVDTRILKGEKGEIKGDYFLYVGSIYPHKNISRLIEAIVKLNQKRARKITLAISSSRGIFRNRLEKTISKLHAEKFVKILGFVPDEKLGGLYAGASAFVYPTLSEGFGLPGLEAMASGTLVAASDIPVLKEVYKDNAIYFDPRNTDSIVGKLEEILSFSDNKRLLLIKKALEFAKRYSWLKMAKGTLSLYEKESSNSLRQGQ